MESLETARRLFTEALALHEGGALEPAERLYAQALALAPGRASVMTNLAAVRVQLRRYGEARPLCEALVAMEPRDEAALLSLGLCQLGQKETAAALDSFDRALAVRADFAEAHNNRGNALLELERLEEGLASYDAALALRPDYAEARYNRGNALLRLGRPAQALASYDAALALRPGDALAWYDRGNALLALRRFEEALASYDRALAIEPGRAEVLRNRGTALLELNRLDAVIPAYRELLAADPDSPGARGYLLNAQLRRCEWDEYDAHVARITEGVRAGRRADSPFNFLAISGAPDDQLACARSCAAAEYPPAAPLWRGERYRHDRIRVAYVSADFHEHAVPFLIAGVIEEHDRSRFEITAISLGPPSQDAMRARLVAAFDRFIDVRERTDADVAALLRGMEIDVAVDLQGYTRGCRPGIFARRPVPVQVNYLGYPGTMGAPYMDYIIGDRCVIPEDRRCCFDEQVVYLPDTYQANDAKRRIAAHAPQRRELGLPERGFVFCCFNNNHKIAPRVFDVWMRLLRRVEGSVLWLLEDNAAVPDGLRREALRRGVAPERLVFAPRARMEDHLARQRRADLFLDTLPYNAHVTASDALWAGLPLLTRIGDAFPGRVAASLLRAAGLPELVTESWEDYERLALRLATEPGLLEGYRARLAANRARCALFDTGRCRRHLEAAYATMSDRAQRGEAPAGFAVPAVS